jgi:hypothetical protein
LLFNCCVVVGCCTWCTVPKCQTNPRSTIVQSAREVGVQAMRKQSALPVKLVCMQKERTIRNAQTVLLGTHSIYRGNKNVTPVVSTHTVPSHAGPQSGAFICLRSCCSLPVDVFALLTLPLLYCLFLSLPLISLSASTAQRAKPQPRPNV